MTRLFVAACLVLASTSASAADKPYPTKPIRLISPFPPGGGTDVLGRMIGTRVSEAFGQPVVMDNRPGAGGAIGAETTVRSEPDGYTLIIVSATYAGVSAYRPPAYDPINDIQAIIHIGTTGLLFTVHPTLPVKNIAELIAYSRTNPGKVNFATVGAGSNVHLAMELFNLMTKTKFVDVPYKGAAPAMTALVGGEVPVTAMSLVPSMPHVKSGKVRALAVTTAKRSTYLPDIPAVSETVAGYEASHWYGMWGPNGLPKPIVMRWNEAVAKVLASDEAQARMRAEGLEAGGGPPEAFQAIVKRDIEKWRRVIREAGIKRQP